LIANDQQILNNSFSYLNINQLDALMFFSASSWLILR